MSRQDFHSLLISGVSHAELKIIFYLIDMCNEWVFTYEDSRSISEFFSISYDNTRKRIANLKRLEIVKTVEYNGRSGLMVNPRYCYQGPRRLQEFRLQLWEQEVIYTKSRPKFFYGPPIFPEKELKYNAVIHPWYGRKGYRKRRFIRRKPFIASKVFRIKKESGRD